MTLSERWQLEAWLIFSPPSVCLRAPKCRRYLCAAVLLKACSPHQSVATIRFTHRLKWVTNYGFTAFSFQKYLTESQDGKSPSRASSKAAPNVWLVIVGHWRWLILSVLQFYKTTRHTAFGVCSSQTFCQSVLEVRHQAVICWKSLGEAATEKMPRQRE